MKRFATKLLLGLLPLALLVVLVEIVLWSVGWGADEKPWSRGFDRAEALIVPADPESHSKNRAWRTRLFDHEELEQIIPPKSERRRVVLLGGSSTQGFSATYLRDRLDAETPNLAWEVLNLGRYDYGSERMGILLEQSLILEPDLVVIYSGHNEFVEGAFSTEVGALARPSKLLGWLRQLRTYHWATALMDREASRPQTSGDEAAPPDAHAGANQESFAPADTPTPTYNREVHHLAFVANLEAMLHRTADAGIPVVLCTVIGNDLSAPMRTLRPADMAPALIDRVEGLWEHAQSAVPARFGGLLSAAPRLREEDWAIGPRMPVPGARLGTNLAASFAAGHSTYNLRPLAPPFEDLTSTSGPHLTSVNGAHWTAPSAWSVRVGPVLNQVERMVHPALTTLETERLETAAGDLRELLEAWPTCAEGEFRLAMISWLLGQDESAAQHFARAARHDAWPARASPRIQDTLRELAARHDHVTLFDADALARAASPGGITGYELLMDQCHLHPGARKALLETLAPVIAGAFER